MMKNIWGVLAFLSVFSLLAGGEVIRPVIRVKKVEKFVYAQGMHHKIWREMRGNPLLLNAGIPQDFGLLPEEHGQVKLLKDKENLYIKAELTDSEVLSEAVDKKSPLMNCSDVFFVVLRPLCDTGFFYFICTPNAIISSTFVRGAGSMRLASASISLKTPVPLYTAVKGKINDSKRDKGWNALLVIPLEKLVAEVEKHGIKLTSDTSWTLMAGRKNFSRFLQMVEQSGYPQPVRGFFQMPHHARLVF